MKTLSEQHRHSEGQVLVAAAFLLTVLVGFMGLAVDVGYFVDYRRRMTAAADAAAVAGAWELKRNGNTSRFEAIAKKAAADNGFTDSTDGVSVKVNRPPTSGDYVGKTQFIEVLINQPRPTFFLRALNIKSTTVAARAVAGSSDAPGCIYVLDPNVDTAFTISGGATINAPLCDIFVNSISPSAMNSNGGACVHAHKINLTGAGSGCFTPTPNTQVPPVADPFVNLQNPPTGSCLPAVQVNAGIVNLSVGSYCGGIKISGSSTQVTFSPGFYLIKNGFSISGGAIVKGSGVTFFIYNGAVSIAGGGLVQLSAPTSGPWEGILFFQNRFNANKAKFAGGGDLLLEGGLYFPSALLEYAGGRGTDDPKYTILVSKTLKFTGSSSLNGNFAGLDNGGPVKKPTLVE